MKWEGKPADKRRGSMLLQRGGVGWNEKGATHLRFLIHLIQLR